MRKIVKVRDTVIGDGKITVQTMLSNKTTRIEENLREIQALKDAGCDIVRIAVSDDKDVEAFSEITKKSVLPIVADIQFDYRLAVAAAKAGADKLRINPSNVGGEDKVKKIVKAAKERNIPIRVGVNMGSLESRAEKEYGRTALGLAYSALHSAELLESLGFSDIVLSVKSSNVATTVEANRIISEKCDYPLHIGVTEAGTLMTGIIKNSVGIGALLLDHIGDTVRISLSAPPIEEVYAANRLLKSLSLKSGVKVISCPTCNRCDYDLFSLSKEIEDLTMNIKGDLTIAVMGCVVNGIGESKDADLGIIGASGGFSVFKHGKPYTTLSKDNYKEEFIKLVEEEVKCRN